MGTFCHHLLDALARLPGLDASVYAVTWRMRTQLEERLPAGVRLLGAPMPARPVTALWRAGIDLPVEWFTGPLDVVHGTNYVVPPARRAARVVSVHDLTPLHFPEMCEKETLSYPPLIQRAVRAGAWVQTASEHIRCEVVEAFGADPARVRSVPYGAPPPGPPGGRAALGSAPYILAVGTVEPRKDYPGLVRAFDSLAASRPDLRLVIAGRDGWGAEDLAAAVAASAHRDRIARLGYLDEADLAATLGGAAVLAYPSRYEGFGFPPLQAMGAGVPVVATAAGSLPEVLGDAAVLVPPGDVGALAAALAGVLDEPSSAAAMAERGRIRAGAFTWESCASAMADLYRDAAASPGR